MNSQSSEATQARLLHALERLATEPRSGERRNAERRRLSRPLWAIENDRRLADDRRNSDRRT